MRKQPSRISSTILDSTPATVGISSRCDELQGGLVVRPVDRDRTTDPRPSLTAVMMRKKNSQPAAELVSARRMHLVRDVLTPRTDRPAAQPHGGDDLNAAR